MDVIPLLLYNMNRKNYKRTDEDIYIMLYTSFTQTQLKIQFHKIVQ